MTKHVVLAGAIGITAADTPDTIAANPPPELEDSAHTGHARTGGSEHTTQARAIV